MKSKLTKFSVTLLVLTVILNAFGISTFASADDKESVSTERSISRKYLSLSGVYDKSLSSYKRFDIVYGGKTFSTRGFIKDGTYYAPVRAYAEALGLSYSYNASTKTATLSGKGLNMTVGSGCYVSYANGRALFSPYPAVIMSDGRLYAPISSLLKAMSLSSAVKNGRLEISGTARALASASSYYRDDEVLWLARIIHAESQGEPLLGQIAVGNIVMNRVLHREYPNTIYSVIFDRKYGVQFSPILNGSIYNTPSYNSTLAAKIVLEGYRIDEDILFFLEPRLSTSSWIPKSREYAFTIGNHDFYR
jgi:N-acetylmuramoyl-L-alanine amidase